MTREEDGGRGFFTNESNLKGARGRDRAKRNWREGVKDLVWLRG